MHRTIKNEDEDKSISANEFINSICRERQKTRAAVFLRGLRYREGLTQEELGKALGIEQSNIASMESGTRPIGKQLAHRLAKFFNSDYRMFL